MIAPLWDDLSQQTGISSITYTAEGTVPNRVFTIQYNQVFRMNANDYPLNFQVKFYETSNKIKFVYGNGFENYSASATDASIGINNRYGAEIYFLSIVPAGPGTGDYSYTTALNNLDQTHFRNLSPGTAFTFTPNTDCLRPTVFTLGTVTHTSVHLSWYPFDAGNSWGILYGPTNFDPETGGTMVTAWNSNYTLNGLDTATAYDIYIRKRCDEEHSLWSRKARFTTKQNPAAIPYSCDFNQDTENARWTLSNSGVNDWIIGPLPEDTVNGNRALFISHDGGITHAYDGNRYAYSWAYRDIYFTPYTNYLLEFDWISNGEGTLDFLRVFIDDRR